MPQFVTCVLKSIRFCGDLSFTKNKQFTSTEFTPDRRYMSDLVSTKMATFHQHYPTFLCCYNNVHDLKEICNGDNVFNKC